MRLRPTIVLGKLDPHASFSFHRALAAAPAQLLICFAIAYFVAMQYCSYAFYRDPTSYFFDATRAYQPKYSRDRRMQAEAFIDNAAHRSAPLTPSQPPMMCIGVATVGRPGEQYVRNTIGSLLEGLNDDERRSIYLETFIAHTAPELHPIYGEKWVETLSNKVLLYSDNSTDLARLRQWEKNGEYRNKTIYDYSFLLHDCYLSGARYVAMIEDDTLARAGWYPRALAALKDVETKMQRRRGSEWLYLRMFYTESLFGWNSEEWPTYLFWSLALFFATTLSMTGGRIKSVWLQRNLSDAAIITVSCICLPLLIILHFMAGRVSMWPLSQGVHEMRKFGCCSQGYIFPRDIVPQVLERARVEEKGLVDMMIEELADDEDYMRWAIVPSLLQHIGTKSSKGYGFDNSAKELWNFGFELLGKTSSNRRVSR